AFSPESGFGILIYGSGFFAVVIAMRSMYWLPVAILPTIAAVVLGYFLRTSRTVNRSLLARQQYMSRPRVLFVTIVPSPYQRELFCELAKCQEVATSVWYLEAASPDSPWPKTPLETYERVLPGFW